jgi:chromosome segregation ATPase
VASDEELRARLQAREQTLEDFRRAAGTHMDEALRLRDALTEQSAAVVELEETLLAAQTRLESAEQESARLRRLGAESEEADRQRRSRLAELEGTLLRLQRQAALRSEAGEPAGSAPPSDEERRQVAELERQLVATRERLGQAERKRDEAEQMRREAERSRDAAASVAADATVRAHAFDQVAAERDELAHAEEALRARITDLAARADGPRLESALAEAERLRGALERSEEQLWEARGRLMADRERLETLERMLESQAVSGTPAGSETQALIASVLAELTTLEGGLRDEAAQLAAVERVLGEWRTAVAADTASPGGARPIGES